MSALHLSFEMVHWLSQLDWYWLSYVTLEWTETNSDQDFLPVLLLMLSVKRDTKKDERATFAIQRSNPTLIPPK